jgi:cytochrome c-type biogenesis protein CcmH/NrfG
MSFWRDEVIDFALDHETRLHMDEQREWIAREPSNAKPYYALAQFYRIGGKADYALALMLEAVRLDPQFAEAHASLCEEYAIRADYAAAWRHARLAEQNGQPRGVELLTRYGVAEQ